MSNTSSNKTSKTNKRTVKVIVGEIGRDTKTGILGRGYSYDNGATFHVTDTMFGRLYDKDDGERMWPNMAHKVADEIKSATADLPNVRKQADEAVKFAESAIAASKVNSDAIVAQSSAVVEAKSAMDSATAEIQQLKANAASDVAQIEATIAEVQAGVNQAKSANESAVQAVQAELKSTSDAMDKVKKRLNEVGNSLDTYAKSAAEQGHDITLIKQEQGQFEADFASAQGNVNQIQVDIKGLRQNVKDNQGNIASLLTSTDKLQASMTDAEKNISNLLLTASKYEQTFKDQDGRLSKVEQTATEHTSELADAKGNIDKVTQKANNLQLLLSDAQKNIQNIQLDAKGLHDTLTGQNNQLANLNVTLNNLDSKYSGITGDLQSKQTALSTEQQQTKDMLLNKADKSEVDSVKGTVNQVSAEQKVMADQINQKVSSVEYQTLKDKVNNLQVGGDNLVSDGDANAYNATPWPNTHFQTHSFYYNGTRKMFNLSTSAKTELTSDGPWFPVIAGHQYTLYFNGFMSNNVSSYDVWLLGKAADKDGSWTNSFNIINGERLSPARNCIVTRTFTVPNDWNNFVAHLRFDNNGSTDGQDSVFSFNEISLKEGNVNTGYSVSPNDAIASIQKNTTAINENSKLISLMAKQTEVDNVKNTAQQISSRLDILAGEVKSKVDETRVNSIVDGKGYATTSTVQSLVDQKAGTLSDTITELYRKIGDNHSDSIKRIQSLTASIDGLQSRVTNYQNDTSSKYTQLSNMIQSKVSASDFNALKDKATWKSTDSIDLNTAVLQQKIFVKGGSNLPPGNYWWYVQVEPGYDSRIVQYAVSDRDNIHYSRQYDGSKWSAWTQDASESEITQLRDDINLRVQKGELLSQINLTAGNTLIQSNKLYLDASSVVITGTAFIPSAAIASLSADKVNTGWLNTNNVSLGDGRTRIRADHDYMYIQPTGSAASNTGIRMGYSGLDFLTNVIPNGYSSSVPYYSVGYDGAANGYFKISAFDHINPGGATATQNWFSMVDAISLTNSEINFATKGNMHMQVVNGGVNVKPTLFFQNNTNNGTYAGFTRLDNSDTVEFNTGNNNGENFHVNSGARFMKYVYFNDYCRAQGWLTYSTLSKKTNIKKLDTSLALDKIRQDDQYLYEYKRNVAKGVYDPQASFIIDDVNDVSQYSVPREFIDQSGKYREPSVELSYLIAAFQEIDKQVQTQKEEIKELKEKLQHE
nr:chromosome partitioning protein ParA [Limosilactobacillus reuteri]